ncbi:MAG TPA: acetate/propionate family kinase [Candidatus Binatia bacterium]|nr:acetate/propionate family kinase [Candidatus Binatia bacterium]
MAVLVLNPGSATLKASLIELPATAPLVDTTVAWERGTAKDGVIRDVIDGVRSSGGPASIDAVGYRVVHGGARFTAPTILDDATVEALAGLDDLAPLHNPVAVETIRAARGVLPGVPHVAVFDTAFHATLPEAAWRYPVPPSWVEAGIRRYGFHGLSVAWSTGRAAELLERPVADLCLVVAHLGGGCSVTAVDGGRSVDTSMGMTPLEGLMMGTRAGSIDPGIVFRLLRAGRDPADLEEDLDRRSGLLAVGGTADMAELLRREASGEADATLAIDMFVRRAAAAIAASATALPGIDGVVFTGGIGEHAPSIRRRIAERTHLADGPIVEADASGDLVSRGSTGPAMLRIGAREDLVIARAVAAAIVA